MIQSLSKFYEPISMVVLSITRLIIAKGFDGHPETASLMFPMLTLKLYNLPTKFSVIILHFYLMQYLLYGTCEMLWAPTALIMFAIVEYLNK